VRSRTVAKELMDMSFPECLCHQIPCICGSDQEPMRMPFSPETFSMLLHREQRSCELVVTVVFTRTQLRKLDPKLAIPLPRSLRGARISSVR
jgi:hypothetical protein